MLIARGSDLGMMRVLHLVAIPQLTGAAEPVLGLMDAQRALGACVDLRIDTKREGNLRSLLEGRGETVPSDLVLSTKSGPLEAVRDLVRLGRLLPAYDVVHAHLSHDHALATLARDRRQTSTSRPLLVRTVHAARVLAPGFWRMWVLRRASGITVACEAHRRRLEAVHAIDPARILVLPGAVDARRFQPDPEARRRRRAQLQLDADVPAIGCLARFQPGRRHEVMLDALALAVRTEPRLRLLLIGHGETEPSIRARASRPDLEGKVVFCGYKRHDLNEWLALLDAMIWLVPGNDATSRAILQGMAAGLPIIGGAVDAIAETVVDGETGLLADPDDPAAVAAAMCAIARDPDRARAMGAAGRRRVLERHDPVARGRRALEFYEALARLEDGRALRG